MLVAELMSCSPICVTPAHSVPDAARLMRVRGIRRLPVLDGPHLTDTRLLGIVTDRDLREAVPGHLTTLSRWEATTQLAGVSVAEVMRRSVVTTTPDTSARDAASTLLQRRIGGMPVVDGAGSVIGMLTVTDLLRGYARLAGEPPGEEAVPEISRPQEAPMNDPGVPPPRPPAAHDSAPQGPPSKAPGVVPLGTLMLIAVLLLSIIWLWMLVLGIQQGRA